jgi:hypothetical protein
VAVENAGYRWAYALLVDVMYRSLVRRDLMALVIAAVVVMALAA